MRAILLNPGPVTLSDGVRRAATETDLCHREPEYFDLQDAVRAGVPAVYGLDADEWPAVLLGGSGTTALEAMIASLLGPQARLLVLENGVYGERLSRIAELHGIETEAVTVGWKDAWDLEAIGERLSGGRFTHVAAVHHETTTGRLNPVETLAGLCEQHGAGLLLDMVSSYGAEAIPFDSPALLACAGTANKCLHGIPGLCFVVVRQAALEDAPPPRTLTLHLPMWAEHQARRSTPFTPPVASLLALRQALAELDGQGGWQARQRRYRQLAGRVRRVLDACGVSPWLPPEESSCVLRSYGLPRGLTYNDVHDGLKLRGFVVYAGQGGLGDEMFRVSTMGEISDYDVSRLETALEAVFGPA
ncbi:MAG: aminotransferase class V-fold PLP-dependent enzyme [Xanthomonadales bacterium]|nr:aminotransferase class V-fold PLP-dependent enzyme [Xanthomonadales bacterium]